MSTRTRKDWILWAQLGCALVATAHAEYTLVTALGQHMIVAGAVTGALDLYVVRALQRHRDVLPAVLVMVAANVASILISHQVVPVHWAVLAATGALAPLLVWRGHRLRQETAGPGEVSTPVLDASTETSTAYSDPYPEQVQVHSLKYAPEYGLSAAHSNAPGDEYTSLEAKWLTEYEKSDPSTGALGLSTASAVPYLQPVPDLPPEYAASAVHSTTEPLREDDLEYLPGAQEYVDKTRRPSIRGLKAALSIGQDRAERLLTHLGVKP